MVDLAVQFAVEMINLCMPFAVVLGTAGIAVRMFLRAAFGGRLEF